MVNRKANERSTLSVSVVNASKSYRSFKGKTQLVFRNVHLTLPQGTVYALLGPSGCGKTSLIRCILGRQGLDEGSVSVFGHCPGTAASGVPGPGVGYMPQEACIPKTLTIAQCWTYYGTILGMSQKKINDAIVYFIQILNLPSANTLNSQLSGGELRRVAFATALIHEPKLLLLDEPTVGIDCITKKNMWEHLLKLANEKNTSMILTTHYIEEARSAHKVGLMHDSRLVVEDYTENLLQRFSCESLEDVFLQICSNSTSSFDFDQEINAESSNVWIPMRKIETEKVEHLAQDDSTNDVLQHQNRKNYKGDSRSLSLRDFRVRFFVLKAIILRNWIHLFRFQGALVYALLLPCLGVVSGIFAFSEVVGQAKIGLVNDDCGIWGDQYLALLTDDIIHLQTFDSDSNALDALRGGHLRGFIVIGQNFSDAHLDRITNFPFVKTASNNSIISITLDSVDAQSVFLGIQLLSAYERFLYKTYSWQGLDYSLARPIIYYERVAIEFISIPSNTVQILNLVAMAMFYAPAAVAVMTLFVDIENGNIERSVVAGVTSAEIVLGLLVILMVCGIVQLLLLTISAFVFSLRAFTLGSFFLAFVVLYAHGFCGMTFGILLSIVCDQVYFLLLLVSFFIALTGAVSGGIWPLMSVPHFFRVISLALPQAYPVRAITAIYFEKGFYLSEMFCSLAISMAYTIGFISLSMVLLKIKT